MSNGFVESASPPFIYKDPDAAKDYTVDWTAWLAGDLIVHSQFIVDPGLVVDDETSTATTATIWLSGGALGKTIHVTNRIVTSAGRTEDQSFRVIIKAR